MGGVIGWEGIIGQEGIIRRCRQSLRSNFIKNNSGLKVGFFEKNLISFHGPPGGLKPA